MNEERLREIEAALITNVDDVGDHAAAEDDIRELAAALRAAWEELDETARERDSKHERLAQVERELDEARRERDEAREDADTYLSEAKDVDGFRIDRDAAVARAEAAEAEVSAWREAAFFACAGAVPTPEVPSESPMRPDHLRELRDCLAAAEARVAELGRELLAEQSARAELAVWHEAALRELDPGRTE